MSTIAVAPAIQECREPACIHAAHEIDRNDLEDFAFHETRAAESLETVYGDHPAYSVSVTRFDNEDEWRLDINVRKPLSAPEALALTDAIRLQTGVANALTEEMQNGQH